METPSSARRVTRSQALASLSSTANGTNNIPISRKGEDSEKGLSKTSRKISTIQDRSALFDITNDSPIFGLAIGRLETPLSSALNECNNQFKKTPGSGEALLRGTVKTLLQKVEEEDRISKLSLEKNRPFLNLKRFFNSPVGLLAPTPANTPQPLSLSGNENVEDDLLGSTSESPTEDRSMIPKAEEEVGSEKSTIATRSLFFDVSKKSEMSESLSDCSSVAEFSEGKPLIEDDDDASVWSIQVNVSTRDDDEEEEGVDCCYGVEGEENDALQLDELCEGMNNMNVNVGKHIRFVYNTDDDEIVEEREDFGGAACESKCPTRVLRLRGLPTPQGKHLRFPVEDGQENEIS